MKTQITYPKHSILKKLIQYFIFIEKEDYNLTSQVCYPNTNHCLSFTKASQLIQTNNCDYTIIPSEENSSYVTGIYKKPIIISAKMPYKEVCINFNPLGLESIFNHNISSFEFKGNVLKNVHKSYREVLYEIIFSNNNIETIQQEIESYLLLFIDNDLNINNVDKINLIQHSTSIQEIEDLLCKSYRSINRYFKNNLSINPKDFTLIKKIRASMHLLFENKNISEIAYDLDFTDTSHFIKTFKKYTNQTPSKFKNSVSVVDNTLIWNIE